MRAVILAAGRGKRMMSYTENKPKCLIEVSGETILSRQIKLLVSCGIKEVTLLGGYKIDALEDYIQSERFGGLVDLHLINIREWETTNSAYGLYMAKEDIQDGYIHLNGDLIFNRNILRRLLFANVDVGMMVDATPSRNVDLVGYQGGIRIDLVFLNRPSESPKGFLLGLDKFSAAAAALLTDRLEESMAEGTLRDITFHDHVPNWLKTPCWPIDVCGEPWFEINTEEDLARAELYMGMD